MDNPETRGTLDTQDRKKGSITTQYNTDNLFEISVKIVLS
jgi:hypothetical protein